MSLNSPIFGHYNIRKFPIFVGKYFHRSKSSISLYNFYILGPVLLSEPEENKFSSFPHGNLEIFEGNYFVPTSSIPQSITFPLDIHL